MTKQELEEEFYSKKLYHSYSSLSKLLYSPALFYKEYVLQEREPSIGRHLAEGKLIHSLMLDKKNFDDLFIIAPSGLPSDNTLKVIQHVLDYHIESEGLPTATLMDYADIILEKLEQMELHQSLKTDEQRIAKIVNEASNEYWEFLKKKDGREIVDIEMLSKCQEFADVIKADKKAMELLTNGDEVHSEIALSMDFQNGTIGLKGVVDNICINHSKGTIIISDIKTTSKSIKDFPESVEFWNYWIQACAYKMLVKEQCRSLIEEDYVLKFYFIAIDPYKQVYCFEVSNNTFREWATRFVDLMLEAEWHFSNRNYTLPYKFINQEYKL
jgi:PD-(D/E)XK nuclease superfamily